MSDDNKDSRYKSYWWLIILLILAFLVCIFIRSPEKESDRKLTDEEIIAESLNAEKASQSIPQKWTPHDINSYSKEKSKSLYDGLSPQINIAIEQLQKQAQRAKHIIPYFPDFPGIWLLPSKDKGAYGSIPERYCIEFLHLLFPECTFIKQKHKWLRNPKTNYPLELDGFCPELMIAIEYNGIQHYVWPNYYHSTIEEFFSQRDRDQTKLEICMKEHICLIRIPYTISLERIPLAIYAKLLEAVPGLEF